MKQPVSYYCSGRVEGIMLVIEALLNIEGAKQVNREVVKRKIRDLNLDCYLEDVLNTFFPISQPKYYLKYTDYLGGKEVTTGFIEDENGEIWYFDEEWAEKRASQFCNEFRNVVVEKRE